MLSKLRLFYILVLMACILFFWVYIPKWMNNHDFFLLTAVHFHGTEQQSEEKNDVDRTIVNKKSFRDHEEISVIENVKENEKELLDLEDRLALELKDQEQEALYIDNKLKNKEKNMHLHVEKETLENNQNRTEPKLKETESKSNATNSSYNSKTQQSCPRRGKNLVGPMFVDQSLIGEISDLEKLLSVKYGGSVENGGWYNPRDCIPLRKVAIIIPYRQRFEQLKIFLRHMHPMLQRQRLYYRIFIVEQLYEDPFNRAALFNVGFTEANKIADFDCFVFTDVDLLPEDDRNYYGCPTSPRHMSVAVDKFNYQLPYEAIFGGCGAFLKQDFEAINGMSNLFWGWGGEDDDLYKRIVMRGYQLTRPAMRIGRYTMIQIHHFQSSKADPNRMNLLETSEQRMEYDGLNTLKYTLKEVKEEPLVTYIKIEMKKSMYNL